MRKIVFIFVLLVALAGCGKTVAPMAPFAPPQAKNVILISIDTLRADRLGAYGYQRGVSPHIDRFAADAVRFDNAYSSSNWTLPSHAGMMTGLMPSGHGAIRQKNSIRSDAPMLAEQLKKAGVQTGAFVSHVYVSEKFGFDRGFDSFDYQQQRPAPQQTDQAIAWLEEKKQDPFFLFLHYFDVHSPYGDDGSPIDKFRVGQCETPVGWNELAGAGYDKDVAKIQCYSSVYDADVAFVDRALEKLFTYLQKNGLYENTLVILTSDHGELFGENGGVGHGLTMFEPEIHVPLLVRFPGGAGGGTFTGQLVSTIQLAPTILEAAGQSLFATDMPSLMPLFREGTSINQWVAVESGKIDVSMIAVINERYKAVLPPPQTIQGVLVSPLLYERGNETNNYWFDRSEDAKEMVEIVAKSGWYGFGTCYELSYLPNENRKSFEVDVDLTPGSEAVSFGPIAFTVIRKEGKIIGNRLIKQTSPEKISLMLQGDRGMSGFTLVMEPANTEVTFRIPGIKDERNLPFYIGDTAKVADSDTVTLSGPTGDMTAVKKPFGGFVMLRSYPVWHFKRPGASPMQPAAELTQEQRDALRGLGYLNP